MAKWRLVKASKGKGREDKARIGATGGRRERREGEKEFKKRCTRGWEAFFRTTI
jgi:hypothetical protein